MKTRKTKPSFEPNVFLTKVDVGRTISEHQDGQIVFSQGEPADSVFYIQKGKVKITVVSEQGNEAVVAIEGRFLWRRMLGGAVATHGDCHGNDGMRNHVAGESSHHSRTP